MLSEESAQIIKQIKHYSEALLLSTANSNLLHYSETDANVLLIRSSADEPENITLQENTLGQEQMQKLQKIYDKQKLIFSDKGISNLFLFKKVLQTPESNTQDKLSAPIFLLPCTLNKIKGYQPGFDVKRLSDKWILNPLLRKNFKDRFQVILPEEIDKSEELDLIKEFSQIGVVEELDGLGIFPLRDYAIYQDIQSITVPNHALEVFFGNEPKPLLQSSLETSSYNLNLITDCDKSQFHAIAVGNVQPFFRIEGPPGTGKSQTITNLIAQALSRNEKILVISDKKVALDVLEQKLNATGLQHLLTLIHDVYFDKIQFYESLKTAYQACLSPHPPQRDEAIHAQYLLHQKLLENYHNAASAIWPKMDKSYTELKSIDTSESKQDLNFVKPTEWREEKQYVVAILDILFTEFNLSSIQDSMLSMVNIDQYDARNFKETKIQEIIQGLQELKNNFPQVLSAVELSVLCKKAAMFKGFLNKNTMFLFDKKAAEAKKVLKWTAKREQLENKLKELLPTVSHWDISLSVVEIESMMQVVDMYEATESERWEKPYREIKALIDQHFDTSAYRVKPTVKSIVKQLGKYIQLKEEKAALESEIAAICKVDQYDADVFQMYYILAKADQGDIEINEIIQGKYSAEFLLKCLEWKEKATSVAQVIQEIFDVKTASASFDDLLKNLQEILVNQRLFEKLTYSLQFMKNIDPHRREIYAAITLKGIANFEDEIERQAKLFLEYHHPILKNTQESDITFSKEMVRRLEPLVQKQNAQELISKHQKQVWDYFTYYAQPLSAYKGEEKEEKKRVNQTRKIMEQEFAKKQKFISIRRFMQETEPGILFKIKPVWLMSPSSVPALFQAESDIFDLVIIDESSRVKLPHSVSAIYRAKKVIVVGDEKQMPPAHFFQSKQTENEEEPEYESILHKAVERLPGVMLTHHYRSKRKDLIAFSNRFMYHNQLQIHAQDIGGLFFKYIEQGKFEGGRNLIEATAIIDFLEEKAGAWSKFSIGIMAFSKEQADTIQDVLKARRKENKTLDNFIQQQTEKEASFFIKNLENVQGDERDIILLSIGYGYNAEGKFRQQFGPLNQEGGERRLNVLITRAKEYMYVFSSIHHYDITLEERLGVTMLKQFLRFAETGS